MRKELEKELPEKASLEIRGEIENFRKLTHSRWGFKVIDRQAHTFHHLIKKELDPIEKAITYIENELKRLESEFV